MKGITLLIVIAFMVIGGCSSGGNCNFDLDSIFNAPNFDLSASSWDCESDEGPLLIFQIFGDGTGNSMNFGDFVFQQTGCRSLEFQSELQGDGAFININGSVESGVLTFDFISDDPEQDDISFECVLNVDE